jgi:choline monooxygenase
MAMTITPAAFYTDPAVFAQERQAIFAKSWLFFGLEDDLLRPGDYIADSVADFPIVVVRDETGQFKGYHNLCRHRAGPLVGDAKGRCDHAFVCRYHGWRYAYDGRLKDTGDFPPPADVEAGQLGLKPVRVETWRGFIFVNMDLNAAPLIEMLRPLDARFGALAELPARLQHSHAIACNWKVYVENYLDGFHFEGVHPVVAAKSGDRRHGVTIDGLVALHEAPADPVDQNGLWAWVWPNLGLCLYRGVLLVEHMRPDGEGRMLLDHIYLYEPEDPGIDAATSASERISHEDAWICERVQKNLVAGVYDQGVFSPGHEDAVAWFQAQVAKTLA